MAARQAWIQVFLDDSAWVESQVRTRAPGFTGADNDRQAGSKSDWTRSSPSRCHSAVPTPFSRAG